jgi:hypothetical protein
MIQLGASPVDFKHSVLKRGDTLVMPANNTNAQPPRENLTTLREIIKSPVPSLFTTGNEIFGAGFYASVRGPIPFALGNIPPEAAFIYSIR